MKAAAFAQELSAKCGLPAIQVQAIIAGAFEAWEKLEKESLVRIHTDIGTICGTITGSFPTSDAPFGENNRLELALRLDDAIKDALADVVPAIVTDETVTKLRLDNVVDVAVQRPYNLIHGADVFRLQGFNMALDDEGAGVYLEADGAKFAIAVDEAVSKQLVKAHLAELPPLGCDGKVVVKSRAGDPSGPLQTSFRRVKYLAPAGPVGPTITKFCTGSEDGILRPAQFVNIEGDFDAADAENLPVATGTYQGATRTVAWTLAQLQVNTDGKIVAIYSTEPAFQFDDGAIVTMHFRGATKTAVYNPQS